MSYTFISLRSTRAAKRHRCIWCGERIERGEQYLRVIGKFEGDLLSDPYHLECREAAQADFDDGEDEFCPYDNERPPTPGQIEYDSWDCALLAQGRIA